MKKIQNPELSSQIREMTTLGQCRTGHYVDPKVFMVQFDDDYAVGSDGSIYQIVEKNDIDQENFILFYYADESNNYYNYAEDHPEFDNEDDLVIFEHCLEQAELLA